MSLPQLMNAGEFVDLVLPQIWIFPKNFYPQPSRGVVHAPAKQIVEVVHPDRLNRVPVDAAAVVLHQNVQRLIEFTRKTPRKPSNFD